MSKYNYSNELYHHGILGMKWGVRRFQDKNGRLTNAGKKRYSDDKNKTTDETDTTKTKKKGLTDKQKKYIKVGAAVAATALVAYGGYKLYQNREKIANKFKYLNMEAENGKKNLNSFENSTNLFSKITKRKPIKEDIKAINPKFSIFDKAYNHNCGNCSLAFEMRQRGFDVKALGNTDGMKITHLGEFFKGLKSDSFIRMDVNESIMYSAPSRKRGEAVQKIISSNISQAYKGDARGMLFFPHSYGSHWINWVKEGNEVKFYDGQNPKIDLINSLFANYKYNRNLSEASLTSIRLDDLEVTSNIRNMVADVSSEDKRAQFDVAVDKGQNFVTNMLGKKVIYR